MYLAELYCLASVLIEKDKSHVAAMMFAWLSISPIFKLSVGGTSFFTYLEILLIMKYLFYYKKLEVRFFVCWMLYFVYMLLGTGNEYTDLIKAVSVPLLIYFIFKEMDYENLSIYTAYYIIGIIISSIIGLVKSSIPNMENFVNYKEVRMGQLASNIIFADRFSGLGTDPNYYSINLILIIAIIGILYSRKEIKGIRYYFIYILMIGFGALTGSKSFILMLVIVTIFTLLTLLHKKQYAYSILFIAIIVVGFILLISGSINLFSRTLYRLKNISSLGFDTGRIEIWKSYYNLFSDNFLLMLFGSGLGKGFLLRVPHNSFLDILALFGIIGGTICGLVFYTAIHSRKIIDKGKSVIPLITLTAMYLFLSMYYSVELPFQILLVGGYFYLSPNTNTGNLKTTNTKFKGMVM